MSDSFLLSMALRASCVVAPALPPVADPDAVVTDAVMAPVTVRVGPRLEPFTISSDLIPSDSFLGASMRQRDHFAEPQLDLPSGNAVFFRLLCAFWRESKRIVPTPHTQYQLVFESFDSLATEPPDEDEALFPQSVRDCVSDCCKPAIHACDDPRDWAADRRPTSATCMDLAMKLARRQPSAIPSINRALAAHLDATKALERSRVTLALRGGYLLIDSPSRSDTEGLASPLLWTSSTPTPTVVNEIRVRCVGHQPYYIAPEQLSEFPANQRAELDGHPLGAAGGCFYETDAHVFEHVVSHKRVLPAFTLWGCCGEAAAGGAPRWHPICKRQAYFGDALEVRVFATSNAPRRPRCCPPTEAALLALPEATLWAELQFHACDDLTFALARTLIARKSKLKGFLTARRLPPGRGGEPMDLAAERAHGEEDEEPIRLKQWPGKDAVQALAAWWVSALLVEGHRYTEPELYALIERCCSYSPDFAVIRKEMVRHGFLEAPEIIENADRTTTTTYCVSVAGMRTALDGDWRTKGVF